MTAVFDSGAMHNSGRDKPEGEKAKNIVIRANEICAIGVGGQTPHPLVQAAFERGQRDAANGVHQNPYASSRCAAWLRGYHLGGGKKEDVLPLLPRKLKSSRWVSADLPLDVVWGKILWEGENDADQNSFFASGVAQLFVGRNPVPGCYRLSKGSTGAAVNRDWHWKSQREFIPRKEPQPPAEQTWDDYMMDEEMYFEVAA
jgi:hypothetical protein